MSDISQWSPVAAQNDDPAPDGFPEGQSAGSLNNSCRESMAAVRRQWEQKEWFNFGHTVIRVNDTQFQVANDVTAIYEPPRRMRMINGATIIYGTILDSVFLAGFTTITVLWDTGAILVGTNVAELGAAVAGAPISPSSVAPQPTKMLGEIFTFAGVAGPAEVGAVYEACDGQVKDAALDPTYIPLYNIIGNVYGGSDQTNFQLPDTRGRSLMGEGTGAGLTARNLGDQPGEESHLLTAAEAAQKAITSGWGSIPTNYSVAGFSATGGGSGPQSNSHLVQQMPAIPGLNASSAHNVIHPALVMHFYIRTK